MANTTKENARKRLEASVNAWVKADKEYGELVLQFVATTEETLQDRMELPKSLLTAKGAAELKSAWIKVMAARKKMNDAIRRFLKFVEAKS